MDGMLNIVSSLGGGNRARDEHGVAELLAQVSRRSVSVTEEERKEIGDIAKRVRTHRPSMADPKSPIPKRATPNNSQHDLPRQNFGKDCLKVDLLRGFGTPSSSAGEEEDSVPAPLSMPSATEEENSTPRASGGDSGVLLRGWGASPTLPTIPSSEGFEEESRKL